MRVRRKGFCDRALQLLGSYIDVVRGAVDAFHRLVDLRAEVPGLDV